MNPTKLLAFDKALLMKRKRIDEEQWMLGQYILVAVTVGVDHALHAQKATSKYIEAPILEKSLDKAIRGAEVVEKEDRERLMKELVANLDSMGTRFKNNEIKAE